MWGVPREGEANMTTKPVATHPTDAVAAEYSGKWVAWNSDHTRIVASGNNLAELWQLVRDQRMRDPVFEKVPRCDVRFVGAS